MNGQFADGLRGESSLPGLPGVNGTNGQFAEPRQGESIITPDDMWTHRKAVLAAVELFGLPRHPESQPAPAQKHK